MVDIEINGMTLTRTDPPFEADERTTLDTFLDYHRATLMWKCSGLTDEQLRTRAVSPSSLSLLGLVRHMTEVETGWFSGFAGRKKPPRYWSDGNRDGDFDDVDAVPVAHVLAAYSAECDDSRAAVAGRGLDETFVSRRGNTISLRWIYVHMIEEYARHNGHADLIREHLDGATGE
ncbi:MAG TPA: DinB family protein [Micromonosporaceae bacterium]|nr:DinB family protein [Micromonosporaceae bacterium]